MAASVMLKSFALGRTVDHSRSLSCHGWRLLGRIGRRERVHLLSVDFDQENGQARHTALEFTISHPSTSCTTDRHAMSLRFVATKFEKLECSRRALQVACKGRSAVGNPPFRFGDSRHHFDSSCPTDHRQSEDRLSRSKHHTLG